MTKGVVARVFVRDDRDNKLRHEVAVDRIGKAMPVVTAVSDRAVTEGRLGLVPVRDSGQDSYFNEAGIIEGVVEDQFELFLCRHWRKLDVGSDRAKVGNDEENALGLLWRCRLWIGWSLSCHRSLRLRSIRQNPTIREIQKRAGK